MTCERPLSPHWEAHRALVFKDTTGTYKRFNTFKQEFNLPSALERLVSSVSQINSLQAENETALFKCL